MLPGWCCIAIAALELGNGDSWYLIPHVRLQVPFLGPESQLKSGFACAGLLCMMIGKALLSGLWARPVGCWCPFIISHISLCFTVRFTFLFSTLVATRLCRCLLRSDCMWAVMPWRLAPCDLGDPDWGDPWFPHGALLLRSPSGMALWFWCSSLCFCCHTMSRWYNVITLALISPWTGTCHASVWLFWFGLLCFALFWWVCFWFLFFGLWWLRDGLLDYAQVLYQFTLEAPQSADGHVCVN